METIKSVAEIKSKKNEKKTLKKKGKPRGVLIIKVFE
jgi:hypothetical protein